MQLEIRVETLLEFAQYKRLEVQNHSLLRVILLRIRDLNFSLFKS